MCRTDGKGIRTVAHQTKQRALRLTITSDKMSG